jgi:hypothetical protein
VPLGKRPILNYQYRNRYRVGDFERSAELHRRLRPDILISGHWPPQEVTDEYLGRLEEDGRRVDELHRELLPVEVDFGAEGFGARIEPYRAAATSGGRLQLDVVVRNPFATPQPAQVRLVVPAGWPEPEPQELELAPRGEDALLFELTLAGVEPVVRARVAADLTVGGTMFGQQAEALVDVS